MSGFFKAPTFHSKTSAVNHAGFPRLLWEMLYQALGCVVNPDYQVFQSEPVPRLCRYCEKVLIHLGPDKIGEPDISYSDGCRRSCQSPLIQVSAYWVDAGVPLLLECVKLWLRARRHH